MVETVFVESILYCVAVDTVPRQYGCWLWPHLEQCAQTVERVRDKERTHVREM